MRGEFVDVGDARLYYYAAGTRGSGVPIIFLHGFPTSGHLWSDVVPLVPEGHRVVVVDLLGYGRSDPPLGRPLSLRAHGDRVVQLMDALRISEACIVGHDLGGGVAQSLAIHAGSRVSDLALINSVAFDGWPARDVRVARWFLPLIRRMSPEWLLPIVRADLERGYYEGWRSSHSIDRYQRAFRGTNGVRAFSEHMAALDARETQALASRLGEIRVPTAVISGEHDPFLTLALGARLAAAIPGASFDIAPDSRHFTPEDAPRVVVDVLARLLARRELSPR
jgi:pimeloyl-ACP methyl ester carboxylesterase